MRALLPVLALLVGGCASAPAEAPARAVRVELALADGVLRPPVFRWGAPVAARVTVRRGRTVVWEVAEGDAATAGGIRRGPIVPPLVYGDRLDATPGPRTLVAAETLRPGRVYSVTVVGYDGTVFEGRFGVQGEIVP